MAAQSLLRIMYIMLNIFDQLYCIMPVAAKVPSMSNDRLQQRAQQFAKAVARLEDACDQPENEFIRDSVIQRFEFCFELSWKMLKLKLNTEGIDASTPRTVIRESVTAGLLDDGNAWSGMLQKRNETSHTYDDRLAKDVYTFACRTALPLFRLLRDGSASWV